MFISDIDVELFVGQEETEQEPHENTVNDQLPVGLLAQLVRALHRYRRGQGSNPGKPDFFRLSFLNCISCVNNCEDLLYIYLVV